jgi:hypothetical protein
MRIAIFLMVVLAGCAELDPKWTKQDSQPQDFATDDTQCEKLALAASNEINTLHKMINYTGCMKGRGWTPPVIAKEEDDEPKHVTAKHATAKADTSKHEAPQHEAPKEDTAKAEAAKH